jgi:hypothetical protein
VEANRLSSLDVQGPDIVEPFREKYHCEAIMLSVMWNLVISKSPSLLNTKNFLD